MGETPVHQLVPSPTLGIVGFVSCCLLAGVLSYVSYVDMRKRIVPNRAVLLLAAGWAVLSAAAIMLGGTTRGVMLQGIFGAVGLGGFSLASALVLEHICGRAMLGGGDVKLLAALGLYLGFEKGLVMLLFACVLVVLAAALAAVLFALKNKRRPFMRDGVPFAPALSVATLGCVLYEIVCAFVYS